MKLVRLVSLIASLLSISCVGVHYKYTGNVYYEVTSPTFKAVDKIEYKTPEGKIITLIDVPLPWSMRINFDKIETYDIDPAMFNVTISAEHNPEGGRLVTVCIANPDFLNHRDIMEYQPKVTIQQTGWAHIYPNDF